MRGRQQRGLALLGVLILALCSGPFVAGPDQGDAAAKALEAVTRANIGLGYLQQGNPGKALAEFKKVIELLPDEALGYADLGVAEFRLGHRQEAEALVKRALGRGPTNPDLSVLLGEILQSQGRDDDAIRAYDDAVTRAPNHVCARYKLAKLAEKRNEWRKVAEHLTALLRGKPDNLAVLLDLARVLLQNGSTQEALGPLQRVSALYDGVQAPFMKFLSDAVKAAEASQAREATRAIQIFDSNGNAHGAMGIDAAHYRNDTQWAIAIGNFANEMSALYVGGGQVPSFDDQAIIAGIGPATRKALTFGVLFFDYDLNGRPDLFHANGHIEDQINQVQASQQYAQPMQLFWNCGDGCAQTFVEVPKEALGALAQPIVGRGAVYADLDGDGDLDLVVTQIGGPPLVLRNDQASGNHWLRVRLEGAGKVNRDAIGSWVELTAGGITQRQQVMPTRSYLSQVERTITFGLGKAEQVDKLVVHWTDGTTTNVDVPSVNRVVEVRKQTPPAQ